MPSQTNGIVIFGSAEIAELAHYYFSNDTPYRVVAFCVDDEYVDRSNVLNLPLVPFSELSKSFPPDQFDMHVALSYNKLNLLRQQKYEQAKSAGYSLKSYVCSKSATWPDLRTGDNCFILENQTIQPTVRIGDNVMIWSGNHLGHGTTLDDHVYISSHVVVSGHCRVGKRTFLGVNATVKDFCSIGDDCFVAMDASVTRDLPTGAVAVGAPASVFEATDRRAKTLKRKYFNL